MKTNLQPYSPKLVTSLPTTSFVGRGTDPHGKPGEPVPLLSRTDLYPKKLKLRALETQAQTIAGEIGNLERELELARLRELYLNDPYLFSQDICGFDKLYEPLHGPLCNLLADESIKKILVLIPRGHFKTTLISICYPLWVLCRNPNARVALISVSAEKAEENLAEIKDRAQRPEFQHLFNDVFGSENTWREGGKNRLRLARRGNTTGPSVAAYGVDSKEVGRHFDIMLLDDVVDQEKVNSQEVRDRLWAWFGRQMSVLDPGCRLCVLGTRWHYDDLYSRIKGMGDLYSKDNPLGWKIVERKAIEHGEVIFPTRFTKQILEEIKKVQGDFTYSCFYDNDPCGEGHNPFDIRKFQWVDYRRPEDSEDEEERAQAPITHIFIDPACSTKKWANFTGVVICDALHDRRTVIRECILEKMPPDKLVDFIFELVRKYKCKRVGIEDELYQRSLIYWVRREQLVRQEHFQVIPIKIPRNHQFENRLAAVQPFIHNGDIIFDEKMKGKASLVEEFERFPKGPHDDLVAAISMIPLSVVFPSYNEVEAEEPDKPRMMEFLDLLAARRYRKGRFSRISFRRMA